MGYKMIAFDLDGTLTNSQKVIPPKTKEAIMKLQEKGVKIVLASGRPTHGIVKLEEELELKKYGGYLLPFNGGQIVDCATGEILHSQTIPDEVAQRVAALARIFYANLVTYRGADLLCLERHDMYAKIEADINDMRIVEPWNYEMELAKIDVPKFMMLEDPRHLVRIQNAITPALSQYCECFTSAPYFLEITPKGIDKAASLKKLLDHVGMDREDLVACGDGMNDKSMIEFAGLGVAMDNARDEVKAVADFITLSNDDEGIAHMIEQYF